MRINEIFHSVQGEGVYTNVSMNFIRLQGCNLYQEPAGCCLYCDTGKSQSPNNGYELSVEGVLERVKEVQKGPCSWYCITGGEPLMQEKSLDKLVALIRSNGVPNVYRYASDAKIEIETNGTIPPPDWFSVVDSWVVDVKTPSAGFHLPEQTKLSQWKPLLRVGDQVKFVVGTFADLEFTRKIIEGWGYVPFHILISQVVESFGSIHHNVGLGFMPEVMHFVLKYNLRLSIQVHKFVGVR